MIRCAKKLSVLGTALAGFGCAGVSSLMTLTAAAQTSTAQPAWAPLAGLPLYFEANYSQANDPAQFVARGRDYQFLIQPAEALLVLRKVDRAAPVSPLERDELISPRRVLTRAVRMQFVGANPQARLRGDGELPGKINYLLGNNPADWRSGVAMYAKVRVEGLYPGINLIYYGNQHQLEYDFVIAAGSDPGAIAIHFGGADKVKIGEQGELVLTLGADEIRQPRPVCYQTVGGVRKQVDGAYQLRNAQTAGFAVGKYDHDLALVIDPVLSYSTYLGGNAGDTALSVKVDTNGFVYVAGETLSTQFSTPGAFQTAFGGGTLNGDAFVAKFSNKGSNLVYLTYLGGSGNDGAFDLAVDGMGNAYVTGFTDSTNFPIVSGLYTNISGTRDPNLHVFPTDAFVAELNTNGSELVYSTYLGGNEADVAGGIAVDPAGNAYVTGYTFSTNFPATNALAYVLPGTTNTLLDHLAGVSAAFVTKIAPNGTALVYSTYLGGTNVDKGQGIAADAAGFAYITGYTASTNFPTTTGAYSTNLNGTTNLNLAFDAFVAKVNTNGGTLIYSTLLGGTNSDAGFRIAVDAAGDAYVTGSSQSPDFPNTATNVANLRAGITNSSFPNSDAFLTKLSPNGTALEYSTLFGGTANDAGWDVALDPVGDAFVVGITASADFPSFNTAGGLSPTNSGGNDVFVTVFNTNASALLYSAYLGGSGDDFGYGIAVDPAANAYIVGKTVSVNFPTVNAFQPVRGGTDDAFLAKILMEPTLTATSVGGNVVLAWRAFAPEFVLESNTNVASPGTWTLAQPAPTPTNGWHTVTLDPTNSASFFRLRKP